MVPAVTTEAVRIEVGRVEKALSVHEGSLRFTPEGEEAGEARTRAFRRLGPDSFELVTVKAGISDGTYTAVEAVSPATLNEGDALIVGYLQADSASRAPSVKLGGKK